MLDAKFIRENKELVAEGLRKRNHHFDLEGFLKLDDQRRRLISRIDQLRAGQNRLSDEVKGLLKNKKDPREKIEKSKEISKTLNTLEEEFKGVKNEFEAKLLNIPNLPHPSVPLGPAAAGKIVKGKGALRKFNFKPLSHIELAEHLDIIDFRRGAKLCGSNFILFKGEGARLERALINFMLDLHTKKHNYKEVSPPFLVNRAAMTTTGQLPKLEEDMYRLKDDDYFLIPTAEVPITNIHAGEVFDEDCLPVYYAGYTACFRREAGSYGKETKGLTRVHQFDKVELVKFTRPENSYDELEALLKDACRVIELLKLPYRVILLPTEEISFAAAKCYDIELYAPGIDKWLEVSSCSNFEDFQARRGNIKYREKKTKKAKFPHTLNGSGVALARLVIAILENYQERGGAVAVPAVLRKYLGKRRLVAK